MKTINKIYNMDCIEGMRQMPDKSVDLVVTDPPYLIETSGAGIYKQDDKQYVKELNEMKDGFSREILDELCRIMKKINIYIFCSQKQIIPLLDYFVKEKKCNWNLLRYAKTNPVPACGKTKFTYYIAPLNQKDKKAYGHPTIKPLDLVSNFIINSSKEGDIVFDPFMGSGTTAVAAMKCNRNFLGYELNPDYYEICNKRIKEASENI